MDQFSLFREPTFFFSGRFDHTVDAELASRYLDCISAPKKAFIWFENSAHSPPFEEPERFNATMIEKVLPLARAKSTSVGNSRIASDPIDLCLPKTPSAPKPIRVRIGLHTGEVLNRRLDRDEALA